MRLGPTKKIEIEIGISDNEIYNYRLNLRESVSARRLTRLPSNPKNGPNSGMRTNSCPASGFKACWRRICWHDFIILSNGVTTDSAFLTMLVA
ncbi:hypothetical protein COLO4_10269 [Corchorus olitorius]|uniref:Uncharacterized protein n=1 Tax=Corchorus olitorius TaxID=93759 RepID=A0A1R3K9A1_9ROSI|nr:hypothetical protein COLO4_10269 [Corchorus olitorius]